ncbi:MAG TPA: DegT/DnrJ/EryC1/StrS family aminotransferase [Planctomycetota bacterium]|nr:DegT/DnrJ/EryC1/StrS family aminotransferase [Planctomycetota bacterium]
MPAVQSAPTATLAINGGPKAKPTPYGSGPRFGDEEKRACAEALDQQTLFFASGQKTKQFREAFAARYGIRNCVMCSSGTAAIHIALAACGVKPGDQVITASITDMGTCSAILLCGAVPVFADLDRSNYTIDPKSVEARITPKTTAIVAVHLTGAPCDMDALKAIADKHDLWLIEDCAQSYHTEYKRQLCGTIGDIGCFSLNDFKHISAGDGGMVVTNDEKLAHRAELFADKCYDRRAGADRNPFFTAPNYRINELTSAVALAQLGKLDSIVSRRRRYGDAVHQGFNNIPGIIPQAFVPGARASYWFYMFRIDEKIVGPRAAFVAALNAEGVSATAGYVDRATYLYDVFTKRQGFAGSDFPFSFAPEIQYKPGLCPNAEAIVREVVKIPVSEFFTDEDAQQTIEAIRKVASALRQGGSK